jgi:hypothetical protein
MRLSELMALPVLGYVATRASLSTPGLRFGFSGYGAMAGWGPR